MHAAVNMFPLGLLAELRAPSAESAPVLPAAGGRLASVLRWTAAASTPLERKNLWCFDIRTCPDAALDATASFIVSVFEYHCRQLHAAP